jgi:MFS superfamily sulfate permease-like transporter
MLELKYLGQLFFDAIPVIVLSGVIIIITTGLQRWKDNQ